MSRSSLVFSITREQYSQSASFESFSAARPWVLWLLAGRLVINGESLNAQHGSYMTPDDHVELDISSSADLLRFTIGTACDTDSNPDSDHNTSQLLCSSNFVTDLDHAILRLDQVDFPPGAIAYRHIHPGAGIRYLVHGGLLLESDHNTHHYQAGDAWFEDANSPVKATASEGTDSRFIRLMLLPSSFEGQPTLTLLNEEDKSKPRQQTNTRHFDLPVRLADFF